MKWMFPAALLAGFLIACSTEPEPPELEHTESLDPGWTLPEFELVDHTGQPFTRDDLRGRWTVLFSGFTHCPDVCPATLAVLRAAQRDLDPIDSIRTVFVTVDPDRDSPEQLAEYLGWFDEDWFGLTGDRASLNALLDALQMASVRVPLGDEEYTMDHATAIVLIDPSARAVAYWPAPHDPSQLAADLGRLPRP